MTIKPIVVALSSIFLMQSPAHADGGIPGTNGASSIADLIGAATYGAPGVDGDTADGGNAVDVDSKTITVGTANGTDTVINGAAGSNGQTASDNGAGGAGGLGGASAIGAISAGGSGGDAQGNSSAVSANGGAGGQLEGNIITLKNSILNGAAGGAGGDAGSISGYGGSGAGGHGGGSVIGGTSAGGAGGYAHVTYATASANGGSSGDITNNTISLADSTLSGAFGGAAGISSGSNGSNTIGSSGSSGGAGAGGDGGGSVFGGISAGGAGGYTDMDANDLFTTANGGSGGNVAGNSITLTNSTLTGAVGGAGGNASSGAGAGGHGGGSVFGGISLGGSGGSALATDAASLTDGGSGGNVNGNNIILTRSTLTGAAGAAGGTSESAGGGTGGNGGGSVFGGISTGGASGYSYSGDASVVRASSSGGAGGAVTGNTITITDSTLIGAIGGAGGTSTATSLDYGGAGAGGHGGGSVFGGISTGGAGGYTEAYSSYVDSLADGGSGGSVTDNVITLTNVALDGSNAAGGQGGHSSSLGGTGASGHEGGSVFGGISTGGAGGQSDDESNQSATGGSGGDVLRNQIKLTGTTSLTGDIFGGLTQGGSAGVLNDAGQESIGQAGQGGLANNNSVTLVGSQITIGGSLYGGWSVNGDGTVNADPTFTSFYQGNTLNLQGYKGSVQGIYNFEQYNWVLPKDVINGDTLIQITGANAVALDNTTHTVAMFDDGNQLGVGDVVKLIDKAQGTPTLTTPEIKQGHFLIYDAKLDVVNNELMLSVGGKQDATPAPEPVPVPEPSGRINPTSKAFLEGRLATLAQINQASDLISDYGFSAARSSLATVDTNLFVLGDGGSSRYETGSHIKLRGFNFAFGVAKRFTLSNQSPVMIGAFVEHGNGHYDSYNSFSGYGDVQGSGRVRYTGGGMLLHMNVAGTGTGKTSAVPSPQDNDGLYLKAVVRAGQTKTSFDSNDLTTAEGVRGQYDSKANYLSAMAGVGYALQLDEKQALDMYSRYTWSKLNSDNVKIGNSELDFSVANSSRARAGVRYSYAATQQVTPYAGLAFEREFAGNAKGSAYNLSISAPTLKGNTGIAELGVSVLPIAAKKNLTVNLGLQGYVGNRKGGSAGLRVGYAF